MSKSQDPSFNNFTCPLPTHQTDRIQLAHGGGGRMTQELIDGLFRRAFDNPLLREGHDGATIEVDDARLAFTTDSYVVRPLFFPGGNIGDLAINGTINDLAMCGARPRGLSAGFILEEGFPIEQLTVIVTAMQAAAARANVSIVTGDTKVVDRGKGDGVYINTAGVGRIVDNVSIAPQNVRPGDKVIINGDIAAHGIVILSVRDGLEFGTSLITDSAALWPLVEPLLSQYDRAVHCLRDPTRGGVASALNEIADAARVSIYLDENAIPIREEVRGACELFGLDPLYVANEGKCLAFVTPDQADSALALLRQHPLGKDAAIIGEVADDKPGKVFLRSSIGGARVVDMISGEQLPRIC